MRTIQRIPPNPRIAVPRLLPLAPIHLPRRRRRDPHLGRVVAIPPLPRRHLRHAVVGMRDAHHLVERGREQRVHEVGVGCVACAWLAVRVGSDGEACLGAERRGEEGGAGGALFGATLLERRG